MSPILIEMLVITSLALSVPALAVAMWHGWKFEELKARNRDALSEEDA